MKKKKCVTSEVIGLYRGVSHALKKKFKHSNWCSGCCKVCRCNQQHFLWVPTVMLVKILMCGYARLWYCEKVKNMYLKKKKKKQGFNP